MLFRARFSSAALATLLLGLILVAAPDTYAQAAGSALISEFRFRGLPTTGELDSALDEFIEIYNNSDAPLTVNATDGSAGWAVVASDNPGAALFVIPNNAALPARGHILAGNVMPGGYSLSSVAPLDIGWTRNVPDGAGIALFSTANPANFTLAHRLDAVGFAGVANALFREGAGLTPSGGIAEYGPDYFSDRGGVAFEHFSFVRGMASGNPQDTGDNEADFTFVSIRGLSLQAAVGKTDAPDQIRRPIIGAPGPQNLTGPRQRNSQVAVSLVDPRAAASQAPNRVRDLTPVAVGAQGTLMVNRTFTNHTGENITRLRFRIVALTDTQNLFSDQAPAVLRALASSSVTITRTDGTQVLVRGLTIEAPLNQAFGGGINASLVANFISAGAPLAPGESAHAQLRLGVQQAGHFRFLINIEAATASAGGAAANAADRETMSSSATAAETAATTEGATATATTAEATPATTPPTEAAPAATFSTITVPLLNLPEANRPNLRRPASLPGRNKRRSRRARS